MIKKILLTILTVLWLAVPCSAAKWTFMVYLDGDNNLEPAGIDDVNEMETVGSTKDVNIVVLFDRAVGYSRSDGNWTSGRVALIQKDNNKDKMTSFDTSLNTTHDWGEPDMGHPDTLIKFIKYGIQTYPAEKYAIVLWNHGGGWRNLQLMDAASRGLPVNEPGFRYDLDEHVRLRMALVPQMSIANTREICSDDSSNNVLYTRDVRKALEKIPQKIHLIGMDACLMGMVEVAYELRDLGEVLVGSQETEPAFGWPYDLLLPPLVKNPDMDSAELGKTIVKAYEQFCAPRHFSRNPPTQSAIQLSRMKTVADEINRFVASAAPKRGRTLDFIDIRNQSPSFYKKSYIDCRNFIDQVPRGSGIDAGPVASALQRALIDNFSYKSGKATGLSIFFPPRADREFAQYKPQHIQFARDTLWDDFLAYIHKGTPIPDINLPSPAQTAATSLDISRVIAVRNKDDDKPANQLNPGETIWLKTYYQTNGIPADYKEIIAWTMLDPDGGIMAPFERLQLEDSANGSWLLINRIDLPQDMSVGKYYAVCNIDLFSGDLTRKAGDRKVGAVPVGVNLKIRSAAPRINRSNFDVRSNRLANAGKLMFMEKSDSTLDLRVAVNKPGELPEYKVRDRFKIGVKTARDAYIALVASQTDGTVAVVFPNQQNPRPFVKAGDITYFPPKGKGSLSIGPPGGVERLMAFASPNPISRSDLESYFDTGRLPFPGTWDAAGIAIQIQDGNGPLLNKITASARDFTLPQSPLPQTASLDAIYNLAGSSPFDLRMVFNVQGEQPVFHPGQRGIKIGVKPAVNAHIALLYRDSQGRTSLLTSGQTIMDFAQGNQIWYFPPPNAGALSVSPPYGVSEVKAVATLDRLNWADLDGVYRYLNANPGRWAGVVKRYEVR